MTSPSNTKKWSLKNKQKLHLFIFKAKFPEMEKVDIAIPEGEKTKQNCEM